MERVANEEQVAFRDALVDAGILVPSSVKGVYGKGPSFVATFDGVDRFVTEAGRGDEPEVYRFPAVLPREHLVRTDYLRSFPDLIGSIHGFEGGNAEHAALLRTLESDEDWSASLTPTDLVLLPAACYPIYPMVSGELPEGGRLFDVLGYVLPARAVRRSGADADVPPARVRARRHAGECASRSGTPGSTDRSR